MKAIQAKIARNLQHMTGRPVNPQSISEILAALKDTLADLDKETVTIKYLEYFTLPWEVRVVTGLGYATNRQAAMIAWCKQQYGPPWDLEVPCTSLWCYTAKGEFSFLHEKDANWFMLRWMA